VVLQRIALMISVGAGDVPRRGVLRVANTDTQRDVGTRELSFVLTLEREPAASFARGYIRLLPAGTRYPIHGSAALFDALNSYITECDAP
jgi:hypothetical protein